VPGLSAPPRAVIAAVAQVGGQRLEDHGEEMARARTRNGPYAMRPVLPGSEAGQ
jgi:hypothetical protein